MIQLYYYANVRKPDPWKGTPGEMIPSYNIGCYVTLLEPEQMEAEKARITQEHIENMKSLPQSWRDALPVPKFWEQPYNIIFEI